jgi:RarD protein
MSRFVGHLCLLTTVIIWGTAFVATKVCLRYLTPVELLGLRLAIGLPALILVLMLRRTKWEVPRTAIKGLLLGSAIIAVHWLIQITGIKYTTATNTGWIIATTPLVLAVMSVVILRERTGKFLWIGVLLATVGVFFLVSRGNLSRLTGLAGLGDWLVLASAHTWAIYTIATRNLVNRYRPLLVTAIVLTPVAIGTLSYVSLTSEWQHLLRQPTVVWLGLLYLGLGGTATAHWFWQEGVSRLGAARSGTFLYIEPLATTAVAVPMLHEPFGWLTAAGGGLVLLGVYISQRKPKARPIAG